VREMRNVQVGGRIGEASSGEEAMLCFEEMIEYSERLPEEGMAVFSIGVCARICIAFVSEHMIWINFAFKKGM